MRIGICTHYAHCDQAYLAIRLADFLREQGVEASLYAHDKPGKLGAAYDNKIIHRGRARFTAWAKSCRSIIWTHVPSIEQLNYVKRQNVQTVIVPMWQDLRTPFRKTIRAADHVVAMSAECRELFHSVYKFKNTTLVPFDTGLPPTRKTVNVNQRRIRLLLPWFDRNARCAHQLFLTNLQLLLTRMPEANLTVAITSSQFSPAIAKFFTRLGEKLDKRVNVIRRVRYADRPKLFLNHDLTLYPAECDNYGFCGLTSIACGTPILTFAVPPQIDFAYPDTNAVVVKTKVNYDEYGVAHADPDYERYFSALQTLIAEPWHIDAMNKRINYNLNSRRKSFETGWQAILRLV
jgi:hypothetical protein